jgi:phosphatidylserine decarboxylase
MTDSEKIQHSKERYVWADPPGQSAFPLAKPGLPLIYGCAFATAVFALLGLTVPALAGLAVTICISGFFRDPHRVVPETEGAVVSPADGRVILAEAVEENPFLEGRWTKISIFMSVFNVHVNRIPFSGVVRDIVYHPGKFVSANLDKASKDNEQNALIIETENGLTFCFVQIAGLVARRIICNIRKGDSVHRGERFGMICFGSRLDIYLPTHTGLAVSVGDRVKAGTSVLGYWDEPIAPSIQ